MTPYDELKAFEATLFKSLQQGLITLEEVDNVMSVGYAVAQQAGCERSDDEAYFPVLQHAVHQMREKLALLRPGLALVPGFVGSSPRDRNNTVGT